MESKIIHEFEGVINGVSFNDRYVFFSVEFIADQFIDKFGVDVPKMFIEDLKYTIERMRDKSENFSFAEVEFEFFTMINEADAIVDLEPNPYWPGAEALVAGFKETYQFPPIFQEVER